MRYLLDSQSLLFAIFEPQSLTAAILRTLGDPANEFIVSAVSPYELEVKKANGKLAFPDVADWPTLLARAFYQTLPIETAHGVAAARLPLHHRDPWDRLLIAQAMIEGLTIVTRDREFARYGVSVVW
jgi:PIN domain nuclease of toxin-antitoxin system